VADIWGCGVWSWGVGIWVLAGGGWRVRLSGEEGCVGDDVKGWGLDGVEGEPEFRLRKLMRAGAL